MLSELTATGKAAKLRGFELIKGACGVVIHVVSLCATAVHLEELEWELGGELMTPSFKLKRAPLQKKYQAHIDAMYAGVRAAQESKAQGKK